VGVASASTNESDSPLVESAAARTADTPRVDDWPPNAISQSPSALSALDRGAIHDFRPTLPSRCDDRG